MYFRDGTKPWEKSRNNIKGSIVKNYLKKTNFVAINEILYSITSEFQNDDRSTYIKH